MKYIDEKFIKGMVVLALIANAIPFLFATHTSPIMQK